MSAPSARLKDRPVNDKVHAVTRNSFFFGIFLWMAGSVCYAQYAEEEICLIMADVDIPQFDGGSFSDDSVAAFEQKLHELNPDMPDELTESPDGWMYLVLADCYRSGTVVQKDRIRGNALLRLAASKGSSQAAYIVAGIDVFQSGDINRQRSGFKVLESEYLERNSAFAAGQLGWAYQQGYGVERDLNKALELYNIAAGRGMTYWQFLLAHAYKKGYLGLEVNEERAEYWREFKPKVHVALYECWVSIYYQNGIFPGSEELAQEFQKVCDEKEIEDVRDW